MKIGRNQPCPCGSGKKYKKCCLRKKTKPSQALIYRRLSKAHDRLAQHLVGYAARIFDEKTVDMAMHEFLVWPELEDDISEDMLDRTTPIFWPWYLFNWEYDPDHAETPPPMPKCLTVAELYAGDRAGRLDVLEKSLIESINRKSYSFMEVISVETGREIKIMDILTGESMDIQERTGSEYVKPGDILFGRAVNVDGVGMFVGLSTVIIPIRFKLNIIQLRKRIRGNQTVITDEILNDWDEQIRQLFFDIDHALHTPPKMSNSDGETMELHRLFYEIVSADKTFDRLCDLCVGIEADDLLDDAQRDENGRLVKVEIPWDRKGHKNSSGLANTILGRIMIDGHRLTAEVNSAERAKALRHEIDARLGDEGRFKVDEIQDMEAMMRNHAAKPARKNTSESDENLIQHAQVAEMIGRHWEGWIDQEIPALGGKTPKDAVKTADGREGVEALLKSAESGKGQDPLVMKANRKGAQRVRKLLGLDQS